MSHIILWAYVQISIKSVCQLHTGFWRMIKKVKKRLKMVHNEKKIQSESKRLKYLKMLEIVQID